MKGGEGELTLWKRDGMKGSETAKKDRAREIQREREIDRDVDKKGWNCVARREREDKVEYERIACGQ